MVGHYERLLEGVVIGPKESIGTLPMLSDAEGQALVQWNATETETPRNRCVHELIEDQALKRPEAVALIFEGQALSYGELNRRGNQLARNLMRLGVGPEVLVGISTDRSLEMIVGILGVLKAGGAYLPLDPTYPPERLGFMMEDSAVEVILSQEKIRPMICDLRPPTSDLRPPTILCLDADWDKISQEEDGNPASGAVPENLAYVIYTSGSTGRPKGTMLSHAGLSNLTGAQKEAFGIDVGSRVLQFSPLSFDASVWETFMALANGGTLCLARQEVLGSGEELARLMRDQRVSNVTLPPSVVRVLPQEDLPELRTVIAAGEACTEELVRRWAGGRDFYNAYGPTETTVCASMKLCSEADEGDPCIGRPLANGRLYVLDGNFQPLPVGVAGELCVGGVSVARGYLRRPDLTADKFIPDPFDSSNDGSARLYRTGDLVKYIPDGDIEFLGRIDQQVKVRGFRIELGEVEAVLRQIEGVKEGVVSAHHDRLVAHVVLAKEGGPSTEALRRAMRQKLPEYMVPSLFMYLDKLPLSPSGKVDRKALPLPDGARPELGREYEAPRNEVEAKLASLCAELLNMDRVGIHDNFFELGGHSLLATQLVSRIRQDLDIDIPLRTIFEHPTVGEMGDTIRLDWERGRTERQKLLELLTKVEGLTEEEVKVLLTQKRQLFQHEA
jgi:amino acid adenylation domain-containing protein